MSASCRHARLLRHDSLASGVYCSAEAFAWGGFPNANSSPQEIIAHKRWSCSWGHRFERLRWLAATTVHSTVDRSQHGKSASLVVGVVSAAVPVNNNTPRSGVLPSHNVRKLAVEESFGVSHVQLGAHAHRQQGQRTPRHVAARLRRQALGPERSAGRRPVVSFTCGSLKLLMLLIPFSSARSRWPWQKLT